MLGLVHTYKMPQRQVVLRGIFLKIYVELFTLYFKLAEKLMILFGDELIAIFGLMPANKISQRISKLSKNIS